MVSGAVTLFVKLLNLFTFLSLHRSTFWKSIICYLLSLQKQDTYRFQQGWKYHVTYHASDGWGREEDRHWHALIWTRSISVKMLLSYYLLALSSLILPFDLLNWAHDYRGLRKRVVGHFVICIVLISFMWCHVQVARSFCSQNGHYCLFSSNNSIKTRPGVEFCNLPTDQSNQWLVLYIPLRCCRPGRHWPFHLNWGLH